MRMIGMMAREEIADYVLDKGQKIPIREKK